MGIIQFFFSCFPRHAIILVKNEASFFLELVERTVEFLSEFSFPSELLLLAGLCCIFGF
jgi:hypothetical protein